MTIYTQLINLFKDLGYTGVSICLWKTCRLYVDTDDETLCWLIGSRDNPNDAYLINDDIKNKLDIITWFISKNADQIKHELRDGRNYTKDTEPKINMTSKTENEVSHALTWRDYLLWGIFVTTIMTLIGLALVSFVPSVQLDTRNQRTEYNLKTDNKNCNFVSI